jgi:exodeoxyribonuclease-3
MFCVLTIATANVNGIRAAQRRGMQSWLAQRSPDILLLQEVRAPDAILTAFLDGWHVAHQASEIAGRAGVAVASRLPLQAMRVGIGDEPEIPVDTGRWVEADVETSAGPLTVVSAYLHSGQMDTPKMDEKYAHLDRVTARMAELAASGRDVLVAGDVNITHRDTDLANWRGNRKSAGTQPAERAHLDRWTGESGFVDVHRALAGDVPGPYTWWSWRGRAFDNDTGWRIDYQFATPGLASRAVAAEVDRAPSNAERWSDHAPLVVTYAG